MKKNHNNKLKQTGLSRTISALLLSGLVATTAQAGKITSGPSATGAAGFGGWNLDNIEVVVNGVGGSFNPATGAYTIGDGTYTGDVYYSEDLSILMGQVLAKDWPVGEPSGIKIINDDTAVKFPKPQNCIMATSYLAEHYLDSGDAQQVTCSSGFQTHKRYKLAMLPSTVDGGNKGVDLVFNVEDEFEADGTTPTSREYQVFQKINNWTDGRLEGFTIEVGTGIGVGFVRTDPLDIPSVTNLRLSVHSENENDETGSIWASTQLANFSEGLFGPFDDKTETLGFFDPTQRAGFLIEEYATPEILTNILHSGDTLGSDYAVAPPESGLTTQFGPWLPNSMLPYGVFFDDDGNPETDAELIAWYGQNPATGNLGWMAGSQGVDGDGAAFRAITTDEFTVMSANLEYTMGEIDDLVNVGLNYIVTVGDISSFPTYDSGQATFTIRITPKADSTNTPAPPYVTDGESVTPVPSLEFVSEEGVVAIYPESEFVIGELLTLRVGDANALDVSIDPEVRALNVMVTDGLEEGVCSIPAVGTTVELIEQGEGRGVYAATTDAFSTAEDGDIVTVIYQDDDIGDGTGDVKCAQTEAVTEPTPPPLTTNVSITSFTAPGSLFVNQKARLSVTVMNEKGVEGTASGTVSIKKGDITLISAPFDLAPNKKRKISTTSIVGASDEGTVEWTAIVEFDEGQFQTGILDENAYTVVSEKPGKDNNNGNNK